MVELIQSIPESNSMLYLELRLEVHLEKKSKSMPKSILKQKLELSSNFNPVPLSATRPEAACDPIPL